MGQQSRYWWETATLKDVVEHKQYAKADDERVWSNAYFDTKQRRNKTECERCEGAQK